VARFLAPCSDCMSDWQSVDDRALFVAGFAEQCLVAQNMVQAFFYWLGYSQLYQGSSMGEGPLLSEAPHPVGYNNRYPPFSSCLYFMGGGHNDCYH